jgi:nitrite reductase/ring-hydroxylating ferredoxin subunit
MRKQVLGLSSELHDRGTGISFFVEREGQRKPAFVIRYEGVVYAYLNQCAHLGIPLDMKSGEVFDRSGELLICAAHGATYTPSTGACAGGPCFGESLFTLSVYEESGKIILDDPQYSKA